MCPQIENHIAILDDMSFLTSFQREELVKKIKKAAFNMWGDEKIDRFLESIRKDC